MNSSATPSQPTLRAKQTSGTTQPGPPTAAARFLGRLTTFFILFILWLLLSGKFDLFHLSLGAASCLIVTAISGDLFFPDGIPSRFFSTTVRFIAYAPWLLKEIFLANIHMLRLVFHPRMMERINPQIIRFRSPLKSRMGLVTLANSITLTPGTITVVASPDGYFKVHAIDDASARGLPGEMEERIRRALEPD